MNAGKGDKTVSFMLWKRETIYVDMNANTTYKMN
jgi:hypothetical protein